MYSGTGRRGRTRHRCYDALRCGRQGKPLGAWKRAWSTAKKQAGVVCRIHDLRHHFISALAQTQTPDATIQAISGHLSRKMLEHYSHVRLEAKHRAVEALDALAAQPVQ
jgi:integrase